MTDEEESSVRLRDPVHVTLITCCVFDNILTEDRVDLSVFSPACLPSNSSSLVGQEGHVYGEQRQPLRNA